VTRKFTHIMSALGVLLLCAIGITAVAVAQPAGQTLAQPTAKTENATVTLMADIAAVVPGETFWLGFRLEPRPGWHTYWRNPGDSGLPTTLEWTLPEGLSTGAIQWPAPTAVPYGPLMNFGYDDDHMLMVPVTVSPELNKGENITIGLRADWLICEEICIPEGADLQLTLPIGNQAAPGPDNQRLVTAQTRWPRQADWQVIHDVTGADLVLRIVGDSIPDNLRFFPFGEGLIQNAEVQQAVMGPDGTYLRIPTGNAPIEGDLGGVFTGTDPSGEVAYEVVASPGNLSPPRFVDPVIAAAGLSLVAAIFYAFLGGILLNLMPCVFPVLSLKALALVKAAGQPGQHMRRDGLAYTAGILVSFGIVAAALLALRAGGEAVGWGFQLQSPHFVMALALVLFLVGLNLSGYFALSGRFAGVGQSLTDHPGTTGAFFTGVLATIVATPCTAPFMAPALGVALVMPPLSALLIFIGLGLGLAFPFLLISMVPSFAQRLPKPGAWMDVFKQILAFPVYATVIWLLWVLGQQAGIDAVAAGLAAMVMLALGILLLKRQSRIIAQGLAGLAFLAALGLGVFAGQQTLLASSIAAIEAQSWSAAKVQSLGDEGKAVFVNFTAAWCVTCLANERVAFSDAKVENYFADHGIVYLEADWTRRDATIAAELERFGRMGVPLYLYYPRAGGDPVILPQLLTPGIILDRLKQAES
jgi:DsbC/DsbD-like thiol-disulfide interchange protein/cytochrome c biogenesis protein CcdA